MKFSETKRTKMSTFTKNISSPITKIEERERNGLRMILRKAYWRMRIGRSKGCCHSCKGRNLVIREGFYEKNEEKRGENERKLTIKEKYDTIFTNYISKYI